MVSSSYKCNVCCSLYVFCIASTTQTRNSVLLLTIQPRFERSSWNFTVDSSKSRHALESIHHHWDSYQDAQDQQKTGLLKILSLSFEQGSLAPVASPSGSGMPGFCCSGPSLGLGVVFRYRCGSSNSTCHLVVCMRSSHAPLERRQPRQPVHAVVRTATKADVCHLKHCFFGEICS